MINTLLTRNNKGDVVMKYLALVCTLCFLCLLTSCQKYARAVGYVVMESVSEKVGLIKESACNELDSFTYPSFEKSLEKLDFDKASEKIEKIRSADLKSEAKTLFDGVYLKYFDWCMERDDYDLVCENIENLYFSNLKREAYERLAVSLSANSEVLEKFHHEFRFALEGYQKLIGEIQNPKTHFQNRMRHCELLFKVAPEEAGEVMAKIIEDVKELTNHRTRAECLNMVFENQARLFGNLEEARVLAEASRKSIFQIESPGSRVDLLIDFLDKELSIFKDVESANKLIQSIEKTLDFVTYESSRAESLENLRKVKSKHNLLLCNYEE